ncbi:hypothetical protein MGN70_009114 [Eutypa lata]|nr:hypothetical protein MGN70_009114 [Eutypa lata]
MELVEPRLSADLHNRLVVTCIISGLSILVVALRFYSRTFTPTGRGWDDWFIAAASGLGFVLFILLGYVPKVNKDVDQMVPEVDQDQLALISAFFSVVFILHCLFVICMLLIKLSVLCFYLRVFVQHWLISLCKVLAFVFVCWSITNLVALLNICKPLKTFWGRPQKRQCRNEDSVNICICVFSVFSDIALIILPMPTVWRLEMKRRHKIKVAATLSLGIVVTGAAIMRLKLLLDVDFQGDITRTTGKAILYSVVEPNLAILCVSLPMLHPLYRKLRRGTDDVIELQPIHESSQDATTVNRGRGSENGALDSAVHVEPESQV